MTHHEVPNDLEIARAQKHDAIALNEVITKSAPYILALCKKWCRPPIDPEDVAQESLIRVAKNLNSFHYGSAFSSWVYTVTYRTFLDQLRTFSRRDSLAHSEPLDEHETSLPQVSNNDTDAALAVSSALEALEPNHRDILILIDVQGSSYENVASELGIPIGTVRSRVARARLALKKILVSQGTFSASGDVLSTEEHL